jgi:hypothetical protein
VTWLKRYIIYTLLSVISLLFLFVARNIYISNQYISEDTAVENAKKYCSLINLDQVEIPRKFTAELLTCSDMNGQKMHCSPWNRKVWSVKMDGLWILYSPMGNPISLRRCNVLMDAKTGENIDGYYE